MDNEDRELKLSRPIEVLIGFFTTAISLSLILFCIWFISNGGMSRTLNDPKGVTIVSIPASFAIFFIVISYMIFTKKTNDRNSELMAKSGWLTLSVFFLIFALAVWIFGHWIGSILPAIIGIICLLKEPRFRELIKSLP